MTPARVIPPLTVRYDPNEQGVMNAYLTAMNMGELQVGPWLVVEHAHPTIVHFACETEEEARKLAADPASFTGTTIYGTLEANGDE